MNFKLCAPGKLSQFIALGCFIICGCSPASNTNTRTTLSFSPSTSIANQITRSNAISPLLSGNGAQTSQETIPPARITPFDLVAEKFNDFVDWRRDCSYHPRLCDVGKFTIIGTQFSNDFAAMMHEFAANNIFARPGNGERKIYVETISYDESTMTAIVHGCVFDNVILYMGSGIYDDKVASSLSSWTMLWHNNDWFWTNYQIQKKVYSQNLCNT